VAGSPSSTGVWRKSLALCALLALLAAGCRSPQLGQRQISVTITADGETRQLGIRAGSTVSQALQDAGIAPGNLDKSEPPLYTVLSDGDSVRLVRVAEEFQTEIQVIPFERQVVRNESLPEGENRLVQAGVNGQQEVTYRRILEDGVETSRNPVKTEVISEAVAEIVMIGAQASFAPLPIPGRIAYLSAGNAWVMDGSTANRRLIVNTGDLDGRIFALSPEGNYLLFTRKSKKPADREINTLWYVRTDSSIPPTVSLQVSNVVNYAGWIPGTATVVYSTVEPRGTAPGWQANNDLYKVSISSGQTPRKLLEPNSGGVYGWWGMSFAISQSGAIAYARPDGIGLVDQEGFRLHPLLDITPLQTHSDWAWIPGLAWGADGKTLFFLDHAPAPAPVTAEESPFFDLQAASMANDASVRLVPQTGMFAYPSVSPLRQNGNERAYQVAFLQAIFPDQSETSRYRLVVMDRDGSDRRTLFPPVDTGGLAPQVAAWAPLPITGQTGDFLAVIYQGNLWLLDSSSGQAFQVTGDGLISLIDWK
jgi:hypothetical protein